MMDNVRAYVLGDYIIGETRNVIRALQGAGIGTIPTPISGLYPEIKLEITNDSGKRYLDYNTGPRSGTIRDLYNSLELLKLFQLYGLECPIEELFSTHPRKSGGKDTELN